MNTLDLLFGLMPVPNLWLKTADLETEDLYPLSFWEYEDLVTSYCQKKISKYLDKEEENNYAI